MAYSQYSAALIISLGERTFNCVKRAVHTYGIPPSEGSGIMVSGYSLEYSREYQPGGNISAKLISLQDYFSPIETKINGLFDIDQVDLKEVETITASLWEEFREHADRTHKDPEKVGITPNQVVIVGDAWDSDCSYLLIPILYCFNNLIRTAKNDTQLNVILDISHFSDQKATSNQEALAYRLVSEIADRIDPNPKKTDDPILKQLGYSMDLTLSRIGFYIVGERKEDNLFAKDHQELEDIIFSFIVGLINPQVREDLNKGRGFESVRSNQRFFSSFGSVGIFFDPEKIIEYCALTLAKEIVNEGFLKPKSIESVLIETSTSHVTREFENPITWFDQLIKKPFFSISGMDGKTWDITHTITVIPYNPPPIDHPDICPYLSDVENYQKAINEDLFGAMEILENNIQVKTLEILEERKQTLNKIYLNPDLYPNLCTHLENILSRIKNDLQRRKDEANKKSETNSKVAEIQDQLVKAKTEFSDTLKAFDPPPSWFHLIPEGGIKDIVRKILAVLQQEGYRKLDQLRGEIEALTAILICLPYAKNLAEFNLDVATRSVELVEDHILRLSDAKRRLNDLETDIVTKLQRISDSFVEQPTEFDFLFDPITKTIADDLFQRFTPKSGHVAGELISENQWFFDLVFQPPEKPTEDLVNFSKEYYQGIRKWNLTQVIEEFYKNTNSDYYFPSILKNFLNKVRNLLSFSSVKVFPNPPIRSALLTDKGEVFWDYFFDNQPSFEKPLDWEKRISLSPYFASFCQARNGIAFDNIEHHFTEGKKQWEALSDAEKHQYDIIPDKDKKPARAKAEFLHDSLWRITYKWDFKPTNKTETAHFEISIQVDQNSYKDLVNRDRYIGQYHLYAEEYCNEIDQLVDHFKKIQWQYKWDSYDQASNVLAFVQSFISYRHDKDTRFVEEYPRYPLETLWDRVGDCEDFAILSGAILSRLGLKVALLLYPNPCHLAFGVETSKTHTMKNLIKDPVHDILYYYGEGTSKAWQLGEIPHDYHGATPDFYRINESSWLVTPEVKELEPEPKTE